MIQIVRTSPITGKTHSRILPVTGEQLTAYFRDGVSLQKAFPNLSRDEREFIKTGITPDEWEKHIKGPGD